MTTLLFLFCVSCFFCYVLTPFVRDLAVHWNLVDHPDGDRKLHSKETPLAGGIAVFVSTSLILFAVGLIPNPMQKYFVQPQQAWTLIGLFLASIVICGLGVADDFLRLRGPHKLLGQVVAVGIVMSFGVLARHIRIFGWESDLGILSVPFTAFWLLGAINSLNLLDGMDGLLGSVGLIICLAMTVMAILLGNWAAAIVTMVLAGALLGFLRYNFPPASVFLGDCGSMFIGLVVGVMAIQSSLKGAATIALAAPLAVFTIPIFDSAMAIVRRRLAGLSIFTTDRGHLHHCLLRRGLSTQRALLWISLFCLLAVAGALASMALNNEFFAILTTFTVVGILIATRIFGYRELVLAKVRFLAAVNYLLQRGERSLDNEELDSSSEKAVETGKQSETPALPEEQTMGS